MLVDGEPEAVDEDWAKEILREEEFEVLVMLGMGGRWRGIGRVILVM